VKAKEAQAAMVLAQVNAIDVRLGHVVDAYDGARERVAAAERDLRANRSAIVISRANLKVAQKRLARRLVALYTSDQPTSMDVILGSASLQDLIDRLNAANDVGTQDRALAAQALSLQRRLDEHRRALERARRERQATVAQLAAQQADIRRSLARRQELLLSIKGQIARLRAQERARERYLAAVARARIVRELAARRAAEQAAAQRAASAPPPPMGQQPDPQQPQDQTPAPVLPPAPIPVPAPSPAGGHPEAAAIAARYLGVPYRWGGDSPAGFDCSGFVMYVYAQLGISLPHYTVAQYSLGTPVSRDELQPGDLVFFDGLGHVGIYIGGGQFIHSPHTGDVVKVSSLSESWYASTYVGARRI